MPTKSDQILINLETARRLSFPDFDRISLSPGSVQVLVNLFLHPGCKSDVNLATFLTGQPVALSTISPHIITAFPSQIAAYSQRTGKLLISAADVLECFALDHADAVEKNQMSLLMSPSYALAHVLTVGQVTATHQQQLRQLVDLQVIVGRRIINFTHILVPTYLSAGVGQTVFHHFGVVVSAAYDRSLKRLAARLQKEQDMKTFVRKITRQVLGEHIQAINYAQESFFRVDMAGQIIAESKKEVNFFRLWQEDDLRKIKIPKSEKVMFQS